MQDYWVTFRIDADGSHDERRSRLLEALRSASDDLSWWDETGAFVSFASAASIEELRALVEPIALPQDFILIAMAYALRWEVIGTPRSDAVFNTFRYVPAI